VTQDSGRRTEADKWEALERRAWRAADLVVYPSEEEAAAVRALEPGVAARALPIYSLPPPLPARRQAPPGTQLLFVAGFGHPPNVDAAIWLVRDILPRIRAQYPNLSLSLVGSHPTAAVTALAGDGIEVTGLVSEEELARRYATARVAVCPLRFGAGVKFKVVEAMYHGLPLVTTPVGAQGLEGIEAVCDVVDSDQAIAAAVIRLIADDALWIARSKAQAAFVADRFSRDAVRDALDAAFHEAAGAERLVHAASKPGPPAFTRDRSISAGVAAAPPASASS
jgi:O-antigen biosynthesis protein